MRISSFILASLIATSTGAWAARDFTPQAGTWVVNSELDGKPGRGLAIDVQGNTFFMQVFGYEKNGDATFYTATGQLDGTSVTAPLIRYTGGRSFGGAAQDAIQDSSPGNVTVSFNNGLKGTVQFPGEEPSAIERFVVPDMDNNLPGIFDNIVPAPMPQEARIQQRRTLRLYFLDEGGVPAAEWLVNIMRRWPSAQAWNMPNTDDIQLQLNGHFVDGDTQSVEQNMRCTPQPGDVLECSVKEDVALQAGQKNVLKRLSIRRVASDIVGIAQAMHSSSETSTQWRIGGMNINVGTSSISDKYRMHFQYDLMWFIPGACTLPCPETFLSPLPKNGTWIVSNELTGKPGRGISLDVQGTTAIAQVFAYQANGQPSFYMGSTTAGFFKNMVDIPLKRYQGGRYLGGPAMSGHEIEDTGRAQFALTYLGATNAVPTTVQFPHEEAKTMQRLMLEGKNWQENMLGGMTHTHR